MPTRLKQDAAIIPGFTLKDLLDRYVLSGDEAATIFLRLLEANRDCELADAGALFFKAVTGRSLDDRDQDGRPFLTENSLRVPKECAHWISEESLRAIFRLCAPRAELRYPSVDEAIEDLRRQTTARPAAPGLAEALMKPSADLGAARLAAAAKGLSAVAIKRVLAIVAREGETSAEALGLIIGRVTRTHLQLVPNPQKKARAKRARRQAGSALAIVGLLGLAWFLRERAGETARREVASTPPAVEAETAKDVTKEKAETPKNKPLRKSPAVSK